MGKYFGTDGVRGVAGADLTCEMAMLIGRGAAAVLTSSTGHKPRILIGKDTRQSGDMLEAALTAGLCSVGADVESLGVVPTPAVAYLVRKYNADAGVVISASHNPMEFNGIKIFAGTGYKLPDDVEEEIEAHIDDKCAGIPLATGDGVGRVTCRIDGIKDYVDYLVKVRKATPVEEDVISFEAEDLKLGISAELAMQWTTAYSEAVHTFANTISTTEGGTHEEGFRAALTSLVNRYARDKGILKDKDENLSGDDVREGLTAVISVKLTNPQFEGQTKTKLGNSEAKTFVQRVMTDKLGDWFDAHPNEAKNIIQKAIEASRARLAAKKARENTRRKSIFESAGMPDKLKDCQSNNPEECELFIVEGDSAGGSAIQGRNPITQAILPLRGKILNTERASLDRMMKSDTIESLITAVGGGYGEDFDLNKVRYHKVIIMADADVDGAHIATLNLTLFFRYMRPMITAGYVYVAMPPLYRLKWTKGPHDFVYTDAERDRVLAEGKAAGRQLPKGEGIQRYKGLGEMSYQELWETTMDPDHRILKQVQIEDAAAADETFSMLMGDEVEPRRLFIQRNARNVSWIDA